MLEELNQLLLCATQIFSEEADAVQKIDSELSDYVLTLLATIDIMAKQRELKEFAKSGQEQLL